MDGPPRLRSLIAAGLLGSAIGPVVLALFGLVGNPKGGSSEPRRCWPSWPFALCTPPPRPDWRSGPQCDQGDSGDGYGRRHCSSPGRPTRQSSCTLGSRSLAQAA
jgi:hypothetical protein